MDEPSVPWDANDTAAQSKTFRNLFAMRLVTSCKTATGAKF
jgi:hypothetical protein